MIRKLRVLLVEDEKIVRETLHMILSAHQDRLEIVGEAGNGKDAVELLENDRPDVIITDIVMPLMNGLELLTYVNQTHPDIRMIVLSGYGDFCYVKPAFQKGIVDYIIKPELNPEDLWNTLESIISQKGLNGEIQEYDPCAELLDFIGQHYSEPITLQEAAKKLHISYTAISSRFSGATGKGFKEYLNDLRIEKAKRLLSDTNMSLLEIAMEVGYADQSYFCKVFKQKTGDSPLIFRNRWKACSKP